MISALITKIVSIIITPVILVAGYLGITPEVETNFGATIPVSIALFETSLASAITADATSMTLVSATTKDGSTLSTSTYAFIIDEGTANEEFVTATCVETACTSMTRGLSVINGTSTVSSLKKTHRRGASVKITDAPQILILSRILNGNETIPNILKYNSAPSHTYGQNELTTWDKAKDYTDGVAIAGSPDAATTVKGISKLSVAPASSTSPIVVGDNDTRVSPVSLVTVTAGQIASLASSTTLSATNTVISLADTATTSSANKVAKYQSNGQLSASTTPIASTDATSKAYVDLVPRAITGGVVVDLEATTTAGDNDVTVTTNFTPRLIMLSYYLQAYNSNYIVAKGQAYFSGTNLLWNVSYGESGNSGGDNAYPIQGNNVNTYMSSLAYSTTTISLGDTGVGDSKITLTINAKSTTGFTIRRKVEVNGPGGGARAKIGWIAYE